MGIMEMKKQSGPPELKEVKYVGIKKGEFNPQTVGKKPDTLFLYFTILSGKLIKVIRIYLFCLDSLDAPNEGKDFIKTI